jgi:hypothetical protein
MRPVKSEGGEDVTRQHVCPLCSVAFPQTLIEHGGREAYVPFLCGKCTRAKQQRDARQDPATIDTNRRTR